MDPLEIKKRLFAGLGQYAQHSGRAGLKNRYGPKPQVAPVPGASTDEEIHAAADSVQMPPTDAAALKSLADLKAEGAANVQLADDVTSENKSVLDSLHDDELEQMLNTKY